MNESNLLLKINYENQKGGKYMDPLIRTEVVIGENTRQLLVERNVTLSIPAIKVRNINAKVVNVTTDVIADKVVIQGVLHKQIFFVGEDNIVHHQAEDIPFSTFIDVPGAEPGMNVQVDPVVETVIFHLLSPTIIHQKVVLEFFVKITETRQLNVITGNGPLVRVDQVVGENTKQELFQNTVTLTTPAIKIDDITVVIRNISTHIIQDKVIIQGIIHKQIFFIGTNNIEFHQAEDIEFSTFVDVPGATPGMDVVVVPTVEFVNFELLSPTTLVQKVVVEFFAKVTESVQINILLGPGALLKLETVTGENTTQILVENVFGLPIPTVKIREIVASIRNVVTEVIDNKVVIQGILHKQIFFIGEDNLEHHQAEDISFSTFMDVMGATPGMNVRVDSRIETILFELLDSLTLRQKVVIEFFVKVTETQQLLVQIVSPYYL
jgi:ribosome biogenesis SPOUT family RNA methylase Rps3